MSRREAETNQHVFALGHYEQMVVGKALAWAATGDPDYALTPSEAEYAATLDPIFAAHGLVTVIRVEPEES